MSGTFEMPVGYQRGRYLSKKVRFMSLEFGPKGSGGICWQDIGMLEFKAMSLDEISQEVQAEPSGLGHRSLC